MYNQGGPTIIHFIVNPTAGGGRAQAAAGFIHAAMADRDRPYAVHLTGSADDVLRLAGGAVTSGAAAVIAVGGDGTVSEVAAVLKNTDVPLGVIGAGSGNDFAYALHPERKKLTAESVRADLDRMLQRLPTVPSDVDRVDMLDINGTSCLNIGNTGIDAEIVCGAERLKKRFGRYAYLAAVVQAIFSYKPKKIALTINGATAEHRYMLMAFCNGCVYGGGFLIAPDARLDDGVMTVCAISRMGKLKMLFKFMSVRKGTHAAMKQVRFYDGPEATLVFEGDLRFCIDGNIVTMQSPLVVKVERNVLTILR